MASSVASHGKRPGGVRWFLHLFVLVAFVILCGLGVWQVQRLQWKTRLLARIADAQSAPAEPLTAVLNRLEDHLDVDYVRVQFLCPGLTLTPTVKVYAVREGGPGRRVVTFCPLESGPYKTILVDRGYLTGDAAPPGGGLTIDPVVGVLRKPDAPNTFTPPHTGKGADWYTRDIAGMAAELNAETPAPVMLMLESPAPAGNNPSPSALPVNVSNNHLGYAVTWFGLALALVGVYIAFLRRTAKRS